MSSFCVTAQNSNLPNMSLVRLASLIRLSLVVTFTFTVSFVKLFTFLLFIAFSNHPGSSLDWSINYLYHSDPVSLQWRRSFFTGSDATFPVLRQYKASSSILNGLTVFSIPAMAFDRSLLSLSILEGFSTHLYWVIHKSDPSCLQMTADNGSPE